MRVILILLLVLPILSVDKQQVYNDALYERKLQQTIAKPIDKPAYKNGILTISNRLIYFPATIDEDSARDFIDQLSFYNLKSSKPVFVIIDGSFGGSVLHGYSILRAIKDSKAPVHILLRTFCYSMCAIIVASVYERTYVLETSMMLFHLPSNMLFNANSASSIQNANVLHYLEDILFAPIASRMGITVKELVARMYKPSKATTGEWILIGKQIISHKLAYTIPAKVIYYYNDLLEE